MEPDRQNQGSKGGKENATVLQEQCEDCPLKAGKIPVISKGLEMTTRRVCALEVRCEDRRKECGPLLNSKVGWKVFWPLVIVLVTIASGVIGFVSSSNTIYRSDHNILHRELNNEIKQMNRDIYQEIRTISGDIKAIKVQIENGGGR